ncbi:methenyltetrahydrofolate synthase domain-containing protein-like [Tubulanus polymorphus]|uniref:methenyltetrahydrofolate synthase domain-containing protein-like n=1 Tax=Tubulanus polymorphus TaxID=672921 RepID=UPI003DA61B80
MSVRGTNRGCGGGRGGGRSDRQMPHHPAAAAAVQYQGSSTGSNKNKTAVPKELPNLELPTNLTKDSIRNCVWDYLERYDIAAFPRPCHRRIPNYKGADVACNRLATLDFFKTAKTVKINPDKAQQQARFLTLVANKTLLVPTPRLSSGLFNRINPPLGCNHRVLNVCSTSRGVQQFSSPVGLDAAVRIDVIVIGSVAVSRNGLRLGKGEGYADLEYAMMRCMNAVSDETPVITCIHDCQIVDLPDKLFEQHDVPVDYIVTPTQIISCPRTFAKPSGIYWNELTLEKLNKIPVLRLLQKRQQIAGVDTSLKPAAPPSSKDIKQKEDS